MHAILGFGQLLQRDESLALAEPARMHLREILRAGQRLLGLINELLDLERIEAGQLPLALDAVELAPLLHDCLQASEAVAQQHRVHLPDPNSLSLPGRVVADSERLKQVLLNLLSNAIKHNRRGGQVGVMVTREGDVLRISVSDTGPGLDEAQRVRLFHAFERLGADRAAVDGAGIGLALSKRLVEMMGGQIGLDSEPGVGSRFWVQLACADAAATAPDEVVGSPSGSALYIEDNPVNVLLMEAMLGQQTQLRLISAELPEDGLRLAREQRPDLILLDIQLPGMDGYEVLRRLRADEGTQGIPVVAVSANAMPDDVARGRAAGFDDYLTKPIDQRVLMATLQRVLQRV
jgi:CheY-like chemotaxis protein